ncbi:hypothetical protein [Serratia sp. 2723]|uniref:hypothetical protein n=1 Tax=unclassified Serratia (in: enterobacteria) TaxID=2647522 RepID=UPI003D20D116
MKMNSLSALTEYLVPFTAKKIDTQLLWNNPLDSDVLAELKTEASYLIEDNKRHSCFDPHSQLLADEKLFYAERYGGGAISHNGGGARCGFDGRWQVKGIGANALVGIGSKQVDGELTFTGAVLEALWGNLMAKLLPYGAVSNKAILLADNVSICNAPLTSSTIHGRRALLVREPVVRPAHFCRAPYYQPHAAMLSQPTDTIRVEKLIAAVPSLLPRPLMLDEEQWLALTQEERAFYGLCELAQRLATQIAFCRSRHLVMMTSPSNCDMQGRLLDFHGMRNVFPGDRQDAGRSYIQHNKLNQDAPLLLRGVQDLGFYLAKYQFGTEFLSATRQSISDSFNNAYIQTRLLENLEMAGFDKTFLQGLILTNEWVVFGERLQNIFDLSAGIFTQRQGLGQGNTHPAIILLHQLIDTGASGVAAKNATTAGEQFSQTFHRLCEQYLHESRSQGITVADRQKTMKDTITRRLSPRAFMTRETIYQEIASWHGEINEVREQLQAYQISFEHQAISILQ